MYYHSYGDREQARALFAELPEETRDLAASLDFSSSERKCPQGLKIGRLMKEAVDILA
jgi:hypothetical protein